jgi:hypothetical protein
LGSRLIHWQPAPLRNAIRTEKIAQRISNEVTLKSGAGISN